MLKDTEKYGAWKSGEKAKILQRIAFGEVKHLTEEGRD